MKIFKILFFFLTLSQFFISNTCVSQKVYSLNDCIEIGLQKSLQIKMDSLDLAKTKAIIDQAYSNLYPSISANVAYQYAPIVQTSLLPAAFFGGPSGTYNAVKMSTPQNQSAGLQLTQILYNPSVLIGLKVTKELVNNNLLQIKNSKENLVYNISATYYNIQTILKQEELNNKILQLSEQLLATSTKMYKAGIAIETDVDRIKVSYDNLKASIQAIKNTEEKLYNLLKYLLNLPLDENLQIETFDDNDIKIPQKIEDANFDPKTKTNYLQLIQLKNIDNLQRKNIKVGNLPSVALSGNLSLNSSYFNANPFKSINNKYYTSSAIGVRLSIPIFDGGNVKNQLKQKDYELSKINLQEEQLIQLNNKEVADAYSDFKNNFITYQNQKRNLELAQKIMNSVNNQYSSGIIRITDVINSQNELLITQNNYINALLSIKQAELNLKKAKGSLLETTIK